MTTQPDLSVWLVLAASVLTAVCTGLGAIPLLVIRNVSNSWLGAGNAVAAGLMLGASIGLVIESAQLSMFGMLLGIALGVILMLLTDRLLPEVGVEQLHDSNGHKMALIMLVMTVHSFAEGIGVGVSFGGRQGFGELISAAIAIHNIPEGLAIALVLVPRGVSVASASLWAIFSSLPQPIMAVPAFLFVQWFEPVLPTGLALAAGAMVSMVFTELVPDAVEHIHWQHVAWIMLTSMIAMLSFQFLLS